MKIKRISKNILLVRAKTGLLVKSTAIALMLIGLILMASMAGFLFGIVLFTLGMVFIAISAVSMLVTFDKTRGWVRSTRSFLFIPVRARRILLEEIDRVEVVMFLSEYDDDKASDNYFAKVKRLLREERNTYSFVYNIGLRDRTGRWELLSYSCTPNKKMYEEITREINTFLNSETVYSAKLSATH